MVPACIKMYISTTILLSLVLTLKTEERLSLVITDFHQFKSGRRNLDDMIQLTDTQTNTNLQ